MKNSIDITVGLCVRNSEKAPIKEAIKSILDQTFPHERMEIIVVDDGSTDKTISIIVDSLSKGKVPYHVYSTGGKGVSTGRQIIVDNAQGKFIVLIDDDMIVSKNFIEDQFDAINKDPSIGIVQGKIRPLQTGSIVAKLDCMLEARYLYLRKEPKTLGEGASIFRVTVIKKVGGYDIKIGRRTGHDTDITRRIKAAGYKLCLSRAEFTHVTKLKNWKDVWRKYFFYGQGMHYVHHKHKNFISFMSNSLPVKFGQAIVYSLAAFKKTREIISFLIPLFTVLKSAAWWSGFIKAHIKDHASASFKTNYD